MAVRFITTSYFVCQGELGVLEVYIYSLPVSTGIFAVQECSYALLEVNVSLIVSYHMKSNLQGWCAAASPSKSAFCCRFVKKKKKVSNRKSAF